MTIQCNYIHADCYAGGCVHAYPHTKEDCIESRCQYTECQGQELEEGEVDALDDRVVLLEKKVEELIRKLKSLLQDHYELDIC